MVSAERGVCRPHIGIDKERVRESLNRVGEDLQGLSKELINRQCAAGDDDELAEGTRVAEGPGQNARSRSERRRGRRRQWLQRLYRRGVAHCERMARWHQIFVAASPERDVKDRGPRRLAKIWRFKDRRRRGRQGRPVSRDHSHFEGSDCDNGARLHSTRAVVPRREPGLAVSLGGDWGDIILRVGERCQHVWVVHCTSHIVGGGKEIKNVTGVKPVRSPSLDISCFRSDGAYLILTLDSRVVNQFLAAQRVTSDGSDIDPGCSPRSGPRPCLNLVPRSDPRSGPRSGRISTPPFMTPQSLISARLTHRRGLEERVAITPSPLSGDCNRSLRRLGGFMQSDHHSPGAREAGAWLHSWRGPETPTKHISIACMKAVELLNVCELVLRCRPTAFRVAGGEGLKDGLEGDAHESLRLLLAQPKTKSDAAASLENDRENESGRERKTTQTESGGRLGCRGRRRRTFARPCNRAANASAVRKAVTTTDRSCTENSLPLLSRPTTLRDRLNTDDGLRLSFDDNFFDLIDEGRRRLGAGTPRPKIEQGPSYKRPMTQAENVVPEPSRDIVADAIKLAASDLVQEPTTALTTVSSQQPAESSRASAGSGLGSGSGACPSADCGEVAAGGPAAPSSESTKSWQTSQSHTSSLEGQMITAAVKEKQSGSSIGGARSKISWQRTSWIRPSSQPTRQSLSKEGKHSIAVGTAFLCDSDTSSPSNESCKIANSEKEIRKADDEKVGEPWSERIRGETRIWRVGKRTRQPSRAEGNPSASNAIASHQLEAIEIKPCSANILDGFCYIIQTPLVGAIERAFESSAIDAATQVSPFSPCSLPLKNSLTEGEDGGLGKQKESLAERWQRRLIATRRGENAEASVAGFRVRPASSVCRCLYTHETSGACELTKAYCNFVSRELLEAAGGDRSSKSECRLRTPGHALDEAQRKILSEHFRRVCRLFDR